MSGANSVPQRRRWISIAAAGGLRIPGHSLPLLMLSYLTACAPTDAGNTSEPVRSDSAGIQVVEIPATLVSQSTGWHLDSLPGLQIGSLDGALPTGFSEISALAQMTNGGIVVTDRATQEARFFDAQGKFIKSVGRSGDGPGEFRNMRLVPMPRYDSLLIINGRGPKLSVISQDAQIKVLPSLGRPVGQALGLLGDRLISELHVIVRSAGTGASSAGSPLIFESTNIHTDESEVFAIDTIRTVSALNGSGFMQSFPLPFAARAHAAVGPTALYFTWSGTSDIEEREPPRVVRRILRVPDFEGQISARSYDSAVARYVDLTADPPATRSTYASVPRPRTTPVWQNLVVDSEGNLWAERDRRAQNGASVWSVFDASGEPKGSIELPRDLLVRQIGADFVLGIWRDADRVEYVRRYSLRR